jgi:hypothetical protein
MARWVGALLFVLTGCHIVAGFDRLRLRDAAEPRWSRAIGDSGVQEVRAVGAIGTSAIAVGTFSGTLDLDGKKLTANSKEDGFVVVMAPDGRTVQAHALHGTGFVRPLAVSGRMIAGYFSGKLEGGGKMLESKPMQQEVFLLELSVDHNSFVSAWQFGGPGFYSLGDKIDITDVDGKVFIAGGYGKNLELGGDCGQCKSASEIANYFFAKLDGGACKWVRCVPETNPQAIESIAHPAFSKGTIVAGEFAGTLKYDDKSSWNTKGGGVDFFVSRFDSNDQLVWTRTFGMDKGQKHQSSARVAAASYGSSALAGFFEGSIDFGDGVVRDSGQGHDIFVARFNPSGGTEWVKQLAIDRKPCDPNNCDLDKLDVALDAFGSVLVTGPFRGTIAIDGVTLTAAGNDMDYFLVKFDDVGHLLWTGRFGDSKDQCTELGCRLSLAIDSEHNALLGGHFEKSIDFGTGALISAGERDGFIAKFAP